MRHGACPPGAQRGRNQRCATEAAWGRLCHGCPGTHMLARPLRARDGRGLQRQDMAARRLGRSRGCVTQWALRTRSARPAEDSLEFLSLREVQGTCAPQPASPSPACPRKMPGQCQELSTQRSQLPEQGGFSCLDIRRVFRWTNKSKHSGFS